MAQGAKSARVRQAVAVFDDGTQMQQALNILGAAGVAPADLSFLAGRETVASYLQSEPARDSLYSLLNDMQEAGTACRAGPVLVTGGLLSDLISETHTDGTQSVRQLLAHWLLPNHADFLEQKLDTGGYLLWVRVRDVETERRACGILLKYSPHPVQVHDLTL